MSFKNKNLEVIKKVNLNNIQKELDKTNTSLSDIAQQILNIYTQLETHPPTESPTNAPKYYVDAVNGIDTNDGLSTSTPWKTISKVNSTVFKAGDIIGFKCGCVWREQLKPISSGAIDNPIVFKNYGTGAKPIINADDIVINWITEGNIYYNNETISASLPYSVVYNGELLTNVSTKELLVSGSWWYDTTNKRVYLFDNPIGGVLEMSSARSNAINTNGNKYLVFDGFELIGCGKSKTSPFWINSVSSDITIKNSVIHNGFYGIMTSGTAGSNCIIENNDIYDVYCNGISADPSSASNWLIKNNHIHHCGTTNSYQLLGTYHPQGVFITVNNTTIEHNYIHDIAGNPTPMTYQYQQGIYTGASGLIIRYNKIERVSFGALKMYYSNSALIHHNILINNFSGIELTGSLNANIYNNLIMNTKLVGVGLYMDGTQNSTVNNLANNILLNCDYVNGDTVNNIDISNGCSLANIDCNLMFTRNYPNTQVITQTNGISAEPLFINEANENFKLSDISPCVNKGKYVGITEDIIANKINVIAGTQEIGAYEYTTTTTATTIIAVNDIKDITVKPNTLVGNLGLPTTVTVTLSDYTKQENAVTWDTSKYATNLGRYKLTGTVANTTLLAKIHVIVFDPSTIELVVNGNFAQGMTGWTIKSGTWVTTSGAAYTLNASNWASEACQYITVKPNTTYTATVGTNTGVVAFEEYSVDSIKVTDHGAGTFTTSANASYIKIELYNGQNVTGATIDNISLKEL